MVRRCDGVLINLAGTEWATLCAAAVALLLLGALIAVIVRAVRDNQLEDSDG